MDYFQRQIELIGSEKQRELASKTIAIIGAGGLGNSVALALGSSGVGKIYIVDFDKVEYHNIHRQLTFTLDDIGLNKADVLKKFIAKRYRDVEIEAFIEHFDVFIKRDIRDMDIIIDATDNLQTRVEIDRFAKSIEKPWIYGSVERFVGQVALLDKAVFEDNFQNREIKADGVMAPSVMQIASLQANMALKYLLNFSITKDALYYLSFENDSFSSSKFHLS